MKKSFQIIWVSFVSLIIIFLLYIIYSLVHFWYNINISSNLVNIIKNTTGATIIEDTTWAIWNNNTWIVIEPPVDPRLYLDYLLQYGSWWIDYIAISPTNQPNMNSRAWSENTNRMHEYLWNNRIRFNIPDTDKQWYILFITSNPPSNISNIFLWVDGSTIWRLNKNKSLSVENKNEFLYKLNEISLIGNNNYYFIKNLEWKPNIYINAVVWESGNKIEKIIIFFK